MIKKITLSTQIIIKEFKKRGYLVDQLPIGENFIRISNNVKSIVIKGSDAPIDFAFNALIAKNKKYTNYFCKHSSIPVPRQKMCNDLKQVKIAMKKIKFPVVVKPSNLAHGKGVIVNIKNMEDLLYESKMALEKYKQIIVEQFIRGNDYRLLIVDGKFISAIHRIPAFIVGDGVNSIKKLIGIENKNPLRGEGYVKPLIKIEIDDETEKFLIKNSYTLSEIPEKGEVVYLKETSNQSKGGVTRVVTDEVHVNFAKMAEDAAKAIGLKYAGVDIITPDISKDQYSVGGYVIEVNSFPGIDMHQYPSEGKGDNVGFVIVNMIEKYYFK